MILNKRRGTKHSSFYIFKLYTITFNKLINIINMDYQAKPDHLNHELVITYEGLERRIDFILVCKESIDRTVNEMKAKLREDKIKNLLK